MSARQGYALLARILISKQWLEGVNPLLGEYTGDEAYERAVATYGGETRKNMPLM